jgi:hypothetical protein
MCNQQDDEESDDSDADDENVDPLAPPVQLIVPAELMIPPQGADDRSIGPARIENGDESIDNQGSQVQDSAPVFTIIHASYLLQDGTTCVPVTSCVLSQHADFFANQTLVPLSIIERMELQDPGTEQGSEDVTHDHHPRGAVFDNLQEAAAALLQLKESDNNPHLLVVLQDLVEASPQA